MEKPWSLFEGIEHTIEPVIKGVLDFHNLPSRISVVETRVASDRQLLLAIQEENNKLKNASVEDRKRIRQLEEKFDKLKKSLKPIEESFKEYRENNKYQDAFAQNRELIEKLEQRVCSVQGSYKLLQESFEYYEEEIINENQALEDKNKALEKELEEEKLKSKNKTILTGTRGCSIDLSGKKFAIAGGHNNVKNAIIKDLEQKYNLSEPIKIVPDGREKRIDKKKIINSLINCDYIVMITGNLSHEIRMIINSLNRKNRLNGDLITVASTRGQSGVLRQIENFLGVK